LRVGQQRAERQLVELGNETHSPKPVYGLRGAKQIWIRGRAQVGIDSKS
jgi:hypothetical protein